MSGSITVFSCPKPMSGHIGTIQGNAVRSWSRLSESHPVDVILLGDDDGVADLAAEVGARHVSDIETNEVGTPLVSSIFGMAESRARSECLCYVNADIILPPSFVDVASSVLSRVTDAVVVGRRVDMNVESSVDFSGEWWPQLRAEARSRGETAAHDAIDYFVFRKGAFGEILPFAVGRFGWDNWLLYRAKNRGRAVVDVSERLKVIHQNHDYRDAGSPERDAEVRENRELLTGDAEDPVRHARLYTLADADLKLTERDELAPNRSVYGIWRWLVRTAETWPILAPVVSAIKWVREFQRGRSS